MGRGNLLGRSHTVRSALYPSPANGYDCLGLAGAARRAPTAEPAFVRFLNPRMLRRCTETPPALRGFLSVAALAGPRPPRSRTKPWPSATRHYLCLVTTPYPKHDLRSRQEAPEKRRRQSGCSSDARWGVDLQFLPRRVRLRRRALKTADTRALVASAARRERRGDGFEHANDIRRGDRARRRKTAVLRPATSARRRPVRPTASLHRRQSARPRALRREGRPPRKIDAVARARIATRGRASLLAAERGRDRPPDGFTARVSPSGPLTSGGRRVNGRRETAATLRRRNSTRSSTKAWLTRWTGGRQAW